MVGSMAVRGFLEEMTYAYVDEKGCGFLIDPGAEPDRVAEWIGENGWTIDAILLTHGHFDHIGAVEALRSRLCAPVWAYEDGPRYLEDPRTNLSAYYGVPLRLSADRLLSDGCVVENRSGTLSLQVISTPGHTQDSVVYYGKEDGIAFVGDTVFAGAVGRTDFPGGSLRDLRASLIDRVFVLPPETILYSGHSEPTTVGMERTRCPIL